MKEKKERIHMQSLTEVDKEDLFILILSVRGKEQ